MKPPIEGMTVYPYGADYMIDAWLGCVSFAASSPDAVKLFTEETGMQVDSLFSTGIDAMIDEATGYKRTVLVAFMDWATTNYWGTESDTTGSTE